MNISQEGISLIKKFEGCELEAYQCAAGVWTIGYGSTKLITQDMSITQEEAEKLLIKDIAVFEQEIEKAVEVPLHQHQYDALVSWTFIRL